MKRFLFPVWILAAVLLLLYSYTQVSLSLALTRSPFLYTIERAFQYIGYFNRPLSVILFMCSVLIFTGMYVITLKQIQNKSVSLPTVKKIIIAVSVILLFAYSAFSFDIFNYIFDAKIVTFYHQNPYVHKALDFPADPMLSFMQWTHREYPYGPFWLVLTVPISFLGANIFIITFYLFKLLAVLGYLASTVFIYKIVKIKNADQATFAAASFALNPLVIIESLVSGHIDIWMMALALAGIYFLLQKRFGVSAVGLLLSILVKFATGLLAPMVIFAYIKNKSWDTAVIVGILGMIVAVVVSSISSGNFQPWYMLEVFAICSLLVYRKYIFIPTAILSVGVLLWYIPYLYMGNWDPPIPHILYSGLTIVSGISFIASCIFYFKERK